MSGVEPARTEVQVDDVHVRLCEDLGVQRRRLCRQVLQGVALSSGRAARLSGSISAYVAASSP
ncbi:hypothetical protein AQJ43_31595 [Streptomyces avermitilis]|nr:hypothetical protein AQJ43_31595 [Streptomyces avermitilis]OOV12604.1 hypothetical protein SM007_39270 [Streptomyces avermitilis]